MAESSNKFLFSDYPTGSIITFDAGEARDNFISQAFTSPGGVPKQVFYSGDKWEGSKICLNLELGKSQYSPDAGRNADNNSTDRKTSEILKRSRNVSKYRDINISERLMGRNLQTLIQDNSLVECVGVLAPFDEAILVLEQSPVENLGILSFGSTLSNMSPGNITKMLQRLGPKATIILLGQDGNTDELSVKESYSTPAFNAFIQEGIREKFPPGNWELETRTVPSPFRVQKYIIAKEQIGEYEKGTIIVVFEAYKYPMEEFIAIVRAIPGFKVEAFPDSNSTSCIYAITPPRNHASPI